LEQEYRNEGRVVRWKEGEQRQRSSRITSEGLNAAYLKQRSPFEMTHRNTTSHHILLPTPIITTVKESCEGSELKEESSNLKRGVGYVLLCRVELSRVEGIIGLEYNRQ
jgi:hypothetical protein